MNLPFYIAKRYLISKKSHNIINIISGISVAGITIGTMALIVVLSVFNGFEGLVTSLFNTFNPDLQITIKEGKTFTPSEINAYKIKEIPEVEYFTEVIEENALLKYKSKQHIVTIKGVSPEFENMSRLDSMLIDGDFILEKNGNNYAILGAGISYYLGIYLYDFKDPISVFVPRRSKTMGFGFENAFNSGILIPAGIFSVQQDFDTKYTIIPIALARELLEYSDEVTSIEIGLKPDADIEAIKEKIQKITGENFLIKDRFQQQEFLYKIMKSEKLAIFLILTFILIIATFNVIGSLSILILDKRKDIAVLSSMGASRQLIRRIFLYEGILISLSGAIAGLFLGGLLCFLQQQFGLIRLGESDGTFVVNFYPVIMQFFDFLFVFITVLIIGLFSAWYPVRQISGKYLKQNL